MEQFTIHCTTCRARLKVHDESLIGQILSCPKCDSFVHVVPPRDWKKPAAETSAIVPAAVSAAPAAAPPAIPPAVVAPWVAPAVLVAQPLAPKNSDSQAIAAAAPPPLPIRPAAESAAVSGTIEPVEAPLADAGQGQTAALDSRWSMIRQRLRQDWLLLTGGSIAGVLLAVVVWLVLIVPGPPSASSDESMAAPDGAPTDPAQPTAPVDATLPDDSTPPEAVAADPPVTPQDASVDAPPMADENKSSADIAPDSSPAAKEPADPTAVPLAPAAHATQSADNGPASAGEPPTDEDLAEPQSAMPPEATLAAPPDKVAAPVQPEASKVSPTRVQIKDRLAEKLPAINFHKVPLSRFAEFLADLSALPITLDQGALAKIGKGPKTLVTVKLSNVSVAEALESAISSHGLTYVIQDDRVIVTVAKPASR